ncbi:NADPH-dependent F420 reductase [Herbidospora cretacea]|uniref:NADPH-dependent F420 reductase n=1 Tax=Herbidospora cretacea TaxID=28444 RepID=UPI000772F135|nr:NAD(P)-binding domain-containing protein [Herbidospora cretacea]
MTTLGILGAGDVARALAGGWIAAGHTVVIGSRRPERGDWPEEVRVAGLAEAAEAGEVVVNATPGRDSVGILAPLRRHLAGKVLIDVANAVELGPDGFATALVHPATSLAETIQAALPETRVVKTLNTMGPASVMADPARLSTNPAVFVSGDDAAAKATVTELLSDLGWRPEWVLDLGDLTTARVPEAFVLMVRPLFGALGPVPFGLAVAR